MVIGKPIPRNKNKPSSFTKLNNYILNENVARNPEERVLFADCLNLNSDIKYASREMEEVASNNTRCKDPVFHGLLSWRTGEQPTKEQVREAVKIALGELGLSNNQCVYACHKDTKNIHVHFDVSRIDPYTYRAIDAGGGFTQKAMERAARRIEYEQGWEVEKNAWSARGCEKKARGWRECARKHRERSLRSLVARAFYVCF